MGKWLDRLSSLALVVATDLEGPPAVGKLLGRLGSFALVMAIGQEEKFKPAVLRFKIDLVSHPVSSGEVG